MSKFSRVLNIEIYTMFRNKRCFASRTRKTAIQRVLEKKRAMKVKGKNKFKNTLGVLDMDQHIPSYSMAE